MPNVNHPKDLFSDLFLSDERLLEYDIDAIIFEETSPYQKVQVVHSKSLGNMLVLDDLQSRLKILIFEYGIESYLFPDIAESDMIYTETLMCRGKEDYHDKEIIILGRFTRGNLTLQKNQTWIDSSATPLDVNDFFHEGAKSSNFLNACATLTHDVTLSSISVSARIYKLSLKS